MSYFVEVRLDKVVCRDPESLTTGDLFALYGMIITDTDAQAFVEPIQRLRTDQYFTYSRVVYSGFANTPTIGVILKGWDKDKNSAWVDNEDDVRKVTNDVVTKLKKGGPLGEIGGDILDFAAKYIIEAIDLFVNADSDDLLLDYRELIPLAVAGSVPGAQYKQPFEIKFRHDDPTGYSDWDYSLFLTVSYNQTVPVFTKIPTTWVPCQEPSSPSQPKNWIGRWLSTDPTVSAEISKSKFYDNLLNVSVTDRSTGSEIITETSAVPISRVFLEAGFREGGPRILESERQNIETTVVHLSSSGVEQPTPNLPGANPYYQPQAVTSPVSTQFSIENLVSSATVAKNRLAGEAIDPASVLVREQIGADFLWLNNQAVLEIYRILQNKHEVGDFGLRYLRPVSNILYRETGYTVAARMNFVPAIPSRTPT